MIDNTFTQYQKEQLMLIADHYGFGHQLSKLCEEMAELEAECWRLVQKYQETKEHVVISDEAISELADVFVVSEQIKMLVQKDSLTLAKVQEVIKMKIERQLERIKAEKNAELNGKGI